MKNVLDTCLDGSYSRKEEDPRNQDLLQREQLMFMFELKDKRPPSFHTGELPAQIRKITVKGK